jgi:WD40 repeat protein
VGCLDAVGAGIYRDICQDYEPRTRPGPITVARGALCSVWFLDRANQERKHAEEERTRARRTSVLADFDLSTLYLDRTKPDWALALAHLARALHTDPENAMLRKSSVLLLTTNAWCLPSTESLHHSYWVMSASFSPDGTRIVTASKDHTARIWDAQSGEPIGKPLQHDDWVMSGSFSPDGTRIVTASEDSTARIWDARSGEPIGKPLQHHGAVGSASFSPDGTRIVTASEDSTARIWDARYPLR